MYLKIEITASARQYDDGINHEVVLQVPDHLIDLVEIKLIDQLAVDMTLRAISDYKKRFALIQEQAQ